MTPEGGMALSVTPSAGHDTLKTNIRLERLGRTFAQRFAGAGLALAAAADSATAGEAVPVKIGYLRRAEQPPVLSLSGLPAADAGLAGAVLAIADNNTTGKFLNQAYSIADVQLGADEDPAAAVHKLEGQGISLAVTDLQAPALLKAADAGRASGMLFFNAGETGNSLREEECRANVVHIAPARSMLADGLAQFLVWKQWVKWVLVPGSHDEDKLWAQALKRAATRFGAKIVEEKTFADTGGARQTISALPKFSARFRSLRKDCPITMS